jgi:hypothetical protein
MIKCPYCSKWPRIEHDSYDNRWLEYCYSGSFVECECGVRGPLARIPIGNHFIFHADDPEVLEADKQAEELWFQFLLSAGYFD